MKLLNKLSQYKTKLVGSALALTSIVPAFAAEGDVDYSTLTSAVSFTQIITVLLGVAATIVAFILVKNNIGVIMQFLKGRAK